MTAKIYAFPCKEHPAIIAAKRKATIKAIKDEIEAEKKLGQEDHPWWDEAWNGGWYHD